jgi:hypothetical protein
MKPRTLAVLVTLTAGAAGLAAYSLSRQSATTEARDEGGPAFPALGDRANDAARVRIVKGKDVLTIARVGDGWGLVERGGYPAKFEKVKETIVALAQVRLVEPRTSNPANYAQIGVEDPEKDGDGSTLVEVADASGARLAGLIVGKAKTGTGFIADSAFYARRVGEAQSWLARPGRGTSRLDAAVDPMQWVERNVLGLAKDRVRTAHITHADGQGDLIVSHDSRESTQFHLVDIPEGRELLFPTSPERVASALSFVTMEDVRPASENKLDQPSVTAEYRTFDGLVVTVRAIKDGDKTWAAFLVAYEAGEKPDDAVRKEADELASRLSPWVFQVPEFQARNFTSRLADLLKPLPGETPTNLPAGVEPLNVPGLTVPPTHGPMGPQPAPPAKPDAPKPEQPPPDESPSPVAPPTR